jgi:hypothetical protein
VLPDRDEPIDPAGPSRLFRLQAIEAIGELSDVVGVESAIEDGESDAMDAFDMELEIGRRGAAFGHAVARDVLHIWQVPTPA